MIPAPKGSSKLSENYVPQAIKKLVIDAELCKLWFEAVVTWDISTIMQCLENLDGVVEYDRALLEWLARGDRLRQ